MPTSLNDPIDGAELKAIILQRISAKLDQDCTLGDDIAYAGFALNFTVNLKFKRSKTADTLVWGDISEGEAADTPTAPIADSYESDIPNQARDDHDLPIPIMVKTATGMERKKVGRPPKVK